MYDLMKVCERCLPLRQRVNEVKTMDCRDDVQMTVLHMDDDGNESVVDVDGGDILIRCKVCKGRGYTLTDHGQVLASLVGDTLKGTVIV